MASRLSVGREASLSSSKSGKTLSTVPLVTANVLRFACLDSLRMPASARALRCLDALLSLSLVFLAIPLRWSGAFLLR